MADNPDLTADEAGYALGQAMINAVDRHLADLSATMGDEAALAFAFGAISACSSHLAKAMGAAYCIDYLDDLAKPLRDFLTLHGGVGTGVGH